MAIDDLPMSEATFANVIGTKHPRLGGSSLRHRTTLTGAIPELEAPLQGSGWSGSARRIHCRRSSTVRRSLAEPEDAGIPGLHVEVMLAQAAHCGARGAGIRS